MRKVFGAICLSVPALLAEQSVKPLDIKTGLWQTTITRTATGEIGFTPDEAAQMTPEERAKFEAAIKKSANRPITTKHCVTKENLGRDAFSDRGKGEQKCTETVIKSTGSNLEVREVCTGKGTKSDSHIVMQALDSEHVKGSTRSTVTTGGRTMNLNVNFDTKWLAPTCPAGGK